MQKNWGIGFLEVLVIFIAILLSGSGSFFERIKLKYDHPPDGYAIIMFLFLIGIATYYDQKRESIDQNKEYSKNIDMSYTARIVFAIIGSVFLLIGIAEVIWNFIPYNSSPYYYIAVILFFGNSIMAWKIALYDLNKKKYDLKVLKKKKNNYIKNSDKAEKYQTKVKDRRLFYVFAISGIVALIISILIQIFIIGTGTGIFAEIISIILIASLVIYIRIIDIKLKNN